MKRLLFAALLFCALSTAAAEEASDCTAPCVEGRFYKVQGEDGPRYIPAEEYFETDSLAIYDSLIQKYERQHATFSSLGKGFIIPGIAGTAIGASLFFGGIFLLNDDIILMSLYPLYLSAPALAVGITFSAIGGKKGRTLKKLRDRREKYAGGKSKFNVSVVPVLRMDDRAAGARLSIAF